MDSLAPIINWFKRNGFWLISGGVAILLLVGWFLASTNMQESKNSLIRKYKSTFGQVQQIKQVKAVTFDDGVEEEIVAHPNSDTEEKMTQRLEETAAVVLEAWRLKREQQEKLMKYPEDVLGENTYRFFAESKPPELVPNSAIVGRAGETYLRTYGEQIPRKFALIARSINANWQYDEERNEAEARRLAKEQEELEEYGMMGGMESRMMGRRGLAGENDIDNERNKFTVIWGKPNQKLWLDKLTRFQNYDDNVKASRSPTLLQAQMLQQDVWLLEAMFAMIKNINGSTTTNDMAVIKEIHHIAFGREARAKLGETMEADKRLGGLKILEGGGQPIDPDAALMARMAAMDAFEMAMAEGELGGNAVFDINSDESPFHGRYVGVDLEPVRAQEVRNVFSGQELPESNLELIVGKRVPFRLAVRMDERKINALLAQCANSPFDFEVMQLRINRKNKVSKDNKEQIELNGGKREVKSGVEVDGSVMDDGMDMQGIDEMMMMEGMGLGGMETTTLQELQPTPTETRISYDVDLEIYGVIKLYNPVRENYLRKAVGLPVDEEEQQDDSGLPSVAILER